MSSKRSGKVRASDRDSGPDLYDSGLVDRRVDIAVSLAALALGLYLVFASGGLRQGSIPDPIGPGGWPRLLGSVLAVAAGILVFRRIVSWRRSSSHLVQSDGGKDDVEGEPASILRPFFLIVVAFAWLTALPYVGFLVGTCALLLACLALMRVWSPWKLAVVPLVYATTVWLVFGQVFGIRFPAGPIEQGLQDFVPWLT